MAKFGFFMLHSGQKWSKVNLKLCFTVVKHGEKSIWKNHDYCFLKKSRQWDCCENFSFLAWKMAKLAFLMVHSGQKWSKVILKKLWPLCCERDLARGLWWKYQLSSMKNGKVCIFDVAQWSKLVKSQFEHFWPMFL